MRLRQIRLAGFKSFVDPTHLDIPGNLAGVVGPNGCGKSNVIDAVRWVLGESRAAELRGESMQDVIFSGSAHRKPAGRGSVELVFDNQDGRIGGEWGRFAEISVKRVLTRDGASSYYINNQTVRRRDVHDMFLGTGVGPRAYAIIGQGMISRIVEARPEELRVFLEEAAGVSRYKERRRETESRLADTRENLTRVEDILRELEGQIGKLEQQAETAARYREMQSAHDEGQHLLWLMRMQEARAEQDRFARDLQRRAAALDEHLAAVRAAERELEEVRGAHYAGADAVHAEQGELLRVNAEIGKLEAESRMIADSRARLSAQVDSLRASRARRLDEADDLRRRAAELRGAIDDGAARIETAHAALAERESAAAQLESAYAEARDALAAARSAAALAEGAIEAAAAESRSIDRQAATLAQRRERLDEERRHLGAPDEQRLAAIRAEAARLEGELAACADRATQAEARLAAVQAEQQERLQSRGAESDTLARLEARLHALRELQANVEADDRLDPWLREQTLESLPRLFRRLHVEPGWEPAFEAVLRERIEALEVGHLEALAGLAGNAPPARVAFYSAADAVAPEGPHLPGFAHLAERVRGHDAAFAAVLGDWLVNVFVADDMAQALAARAQLPPGGQFVLRGGHLVSRHAVRFFAADDRKAGLLARRQEIGNLERELRAQKLLLEQAAAALARSQTQALAAAEQLRQERDGYERLRGALHAAQLEAVRLAELIDRLKHRAGQIEVEAAEIAAQERELSRQRDEGGARFERLDAELAVKQQAVETAKLGYEEADRRLREGREVVRQLASDRQRIEFELAAARERSQDVAHAIDAAGAEAERLAADLETASAELARLDDSAVRGELDRWLGERARFGERLLEARSRLDELTQRMRATDEKRLTLERDAPPLRQRITELQLKEQAARLAAEQFAGLLAQAGADETALRARLEAEPLKPAALQGEITRLAQAIADLGAVNLAALDELAAAGERRGFLERQSADLTAAMRTLEEAIRRIDRETRDLLQQTFDQVNEHFGQLFPRLFGGGEARLKMTGEEILDAGVQVLAQPPGKRTTTIHLLSGGEKALTATALVFALFKLNPAPFCLLDEVDAPLDDANTERFCDLVRSMTGSTQFLFITHNKIAMEMAEQLIGVTMQEQGVSRIVAVDIEAAQRLTTESV